jgi:WD40 repeat protein
LPFRSSELGISAIIPNSNYALISWLAESKNGNWYYTRIVLDKLTGKIIKNFGFGKDDNNKYKVSPDGKYIAIALKNDNVELWDAKTFTKIQALGNFSAVSLAFSTDGSKLLLNGSGPSDINIIDMDSRALINNWDVEPGNQSTVSLKGIFINNEFILAHASYVIGSDFYTSARLYKIFNQEIIKQFDYRAHVLASYNNFALIDSGSTVVLIKIDENLLSIPNGKIDKYPVIFPNPTTNTISIQFPENITGLISITIIDINGKSISQLSEPAEIRIKEINVSALPNGIYFIKVTGKSYSVTYKLVKE